VVTRSAGLTLNWTGGNATDLVEIVGLAGTYSSGANSALTGAEFICTTTAGTGTFTVSASILSQLPAVTASAIAANTASSLLEVLSTVNPTAGGGLFSAPLAAGGTVSSDLFRVAGHRDRTGLSIETCPALRGPAASRCRSKSANVAPLPARPAAAD